MVWNGTRISQAAARPPPPLHLADPATFGMLDIAAGRQLRVTKRDCKTWFDQLLVHPDIGSFFGRPRVLRQELLDVGFSNDDIFSLGGADGIDSFVPCSRVWPMGFAWSSFVAQSTLMSICDRANLTEDLVLASDRPIPTTMSLAFAVATDDLMVFSNGNAGATVAAAEKVEGVMVTHGIEKNPDKDVNDALPACCVGVDLVDGRSWSPPAERIWRHLDAMIDFSSHRIGSRGGVAGVVG